MSGKLYTSMCGLHNDGRTSYCFSKSAPQEHVMKREMKRPEKGALGNSNCNFSMLRCLIIESHEDIPRSSKNFEPVEPLCHKPSFLAYLVIYCGCPCWMQCRGQILPRLKPFPCRLKCMLFKTLTAVMVQWCGRKWKTYKTILKGQDCAKLSKENTMILKNRKFYTGQ